MVVEVGLVLAEDRCGVALVDDEDLVEEFAADAADEPLGGRVRAGRSNRCFDHLNPCGSEDGVEHGGELGVVVWDEVPEVLAGVVEVRGEIARLLGEPGAGGVGGDAEDVDLVGGVFDDEERVEPGQCDGVEVEQVAGQDRVGLGSAGTASRSDRTAVVRGRFRRR
jgi:hypothetical protein